MARTTTLTYDTVAAVATRLRVAGNPSPSAKHIRDELVANTPRGEAVGSLNTIQRHLTVWRANQEPIGGEVPEGLPRALVTDLQRAIAMAEVAGRAEAEEKLAEVRRDIAELVSIGEINDQQIESLQGELDAARGEIGRLSGVLDERTQDLANARQHAAQVEATLRDQTELAARAQREAALAEGRVAEMRRLMDHQQTEQAQKAEQLTTKLDEMRHRASSVESALAAKAAELAATEQRCADLLERLSRAESALQLALPFKAEAEAAKAAEKELRDHMVTLRAAAQLPSLSTGR